MGGNAVDEKEEILEFDGADLLGGWRYLHLWVGGGLLEVLFSGRRVLFSKASDLFSVEEIYELNLVIYFPL